jgi:DNA repair and recombination protein RAD52
MTHLPELIATQAVGFSLEQTDLLHQPLSAALIKQRPGPGGKQLKYITGKTAIDTANRIFGVGKWGYRVLSKSREVVGDKEFYTADVELYVVGCPFPFPGEGEGIPLNNTVEQHAKARKEAVTDALKRALRHFGDQFGLCLYDEDSYVEASDGTPVQVKHVQPTNGAAPQPKRTVDATPPPAKEKFSDKALHDMIGRAKSKAAQLGIVHNLPEWEALLSHLKIEEIKTVADVGKVNDYLKRIEQQQSGPRLEVVK